MLQTARLPSEYQEVEWIRGNGGYINTNYIPSIYTSARLKYELVSSPSISTFFGINHQTFRAEVRYANRWYGYAMGLLNIGDESSAAVYNKGVSVGVLYNLTIDERGLTVDGYTTKGRTSSFDVTLPIFLFAGNTANGTPSQIMSDLKIYSFQLSENGVLSLDFLPCYRKSDGEIGMYDTVSKTFYTNAGTGTFLKGADV